MRIGHRACASFTFGDSATGRDQAMRESAKSKRVNKKLRPLRLCARALFPMSDEELLALQRSAELLGKGSFCAITHDGIVRVAKGARIDRDIVLR